MTELNIFRAYQAYVENNCDFLAPQLNNQTVATTNLAILRQVMKMDDAHEVSILQAWQPSHSRTDLHANMLFSA